MPTSGSKHKEKDAGSAKEKAQSKKGKAAEKSPQEETAPAINDPAQLNAKISDAGNKVRELKSQKAAKDQIDAAVKVLLALKADYKKATGQDWKPGAAQPAAASPAAASATDPAAINEKIVEQGNKVRELKGQKAPKVGIS